MRVTNLILHIIIMIVMLPDLVFIGLNSLVGLPYFNFVELIMVTVIDLVFGAAFLTSTVGGVIQVAKYKKTSPKVYFKRVLISHGLSALSFAIAIWYLIRIKLHSSVEGSGFSMAINVAGFILCLAAITVNLIIGLKKIKKADAVALASANAQAAAQSNQITSRPKFCSNCGKPTGETGTFCNNCGTRLVK